MWAARSVQAAPALCCRDSSFASTRSVAKVRRRGEQEHATIDVPSLLATEHRANDGRGWAPRPTSTDQLTQHA
eukprot:10512148-Alexandrium_andersonii.AAC.1